MTKTWQHILALLLLTAGLTLLYIQPPGVSDDLGYWINAQRMHEEGLKSWTTNFHHLRWPVWGVCWLLQAIFGFGMAAYTGEVMVYACAGVAVCFALGRMLLRTIGGAWACGLAFFFHPLLDDVLSGPWPDLSEAVWCGVSLLCWWQLMHASSRGRSIAWAALTGLALFLTETNRLTGVFIIPVLGLCTLLFFRRRTGWLIAAGVFAAACYGLEMAFYHSLFKDPWHSLHSNQAGKGVRGTEPIPLLTVPFRFLDSLWTNHALSPLYTLCGLVGVWVACTRRLRTAPEPEGTPSPLVLGKVLVVWAVVGYLAYACAPQSLSPWRPVVRDGTRFIASLAVPLSILAAAGLVWMLRQALACDWRPVRWLSSRQVAAGAIVILALIAGSYLTRPLPTLSYIPALRQYVQNTPDGTAVMVPVQMRSLALLAAGKSALRLRWLPNENMPSWDRRGEALLGESQEVWYVRDSLFGPFRRADFLRIAPLTLTHYLSCFSNDEANWPLSQVLLRNDTPFLVFQRRRTPESSSRQLFTPEDELLKPFVPALPFAWEKAKTARKGTRFDWPISPALRGALCTLVLESSSDQVEPYTADLTFYAGQKVVGTCKLKPYCFSYPARDFLTFPIPSEADRCDFRVKNYKRTEWVKLQSLRLFVDQPRPAR